MKEIACYRCSNLFPESIDGNLACMAFPRGIPDEILNGSVEHKSVVKGQFMNFVFNERNDEITPMFNDRKAFDEYYEPCSMCKNFNHGECPVLEGIPFSIIKRHGHKKEFPYQKNTGYVFKEK